MFVVSENPSRVGEYTTSGAVVNASLISLPDPVAIALSGSNLFVTDTYLNNISEYPTSGAIVNSSLVSGLSAPWGLAVYGDNLFVTNENFGGQPNTGTIGEYTMSGAVVNSSLVSGLSGAVGIAVDGTNIFVGNSDSNTIGKYTMAGSTVNATLIAGASGLTETSPVPEPSTLALLAASAASLMGWSWRRILTSRTNARTEGDVPTRLSFPARSFATRAIRRAA